MGWTKGQLIDEAFAELSLAGYVFDLQPEERQTALRRLDAMMAKLDGDGIRVGYALTADPTAVDEATDSGLALNAVEPVYLNLAVRLCAWKGKTLPVTTAIAAKAGMETLMAIAAMPREQQFRSGLPAGAGNKTQRTGQVYLPPPDTSPIQTGEGGDLDFLEP